MPKIKLLRDVTFPNGVKAKGETVETDQSTADWLIKVGAAQVLKSKTAQPKTNQKPTPKGD